MFLTTPDEFEKYVEFIEKTLQAKVMMQSSSSCNCARDYSIEILSLFDTELQLDNTKNLKDLLGESKSLQFRKL